MRIFKPRPRYRVNYHAVSKHLGVNLRGNESFDELLEIEQQVKEHKERLAEMKANIQRVDAQVKGVKKW